MSTNPKNSANTPSTKTESLPKKLEGKATQYVPPKIEKLGSLEQLTQSSGSM